MTISRQQMNQHAVAALFGTLFGAGVLGWGAGWISSPYQAFGDLLEESVSVTVVAEAIRKVLEGWH